MPLSGMRVAQPEEVGLLLTDHDSPPEESQPLSLFGPNLPPEAQTTIRVVAAA